MTPERVQLKEYITFTDETLKKVYELDPYETGVLIWALMSADEYGIAKPADFIQGKRISKKRFALALASIEEKGFIRQNGPDTIQIINWRQYNL